jgi:hypothetical protein
MSLLRSTPSDGTPWRDLFSAALVAVALPFFLGGAILLTIGLLPQVFWGDGVLLAWVIGMALLLSPFLTLAAMVLAIPLTAVLVRAGWFGWGPAASLGLGLGGLTGAMIDFPPGAAFGLCIALIKRGVLGRLRPMATI